MRIVFMGTPAFAATILDDLAQQHEVLAVYTRPDAVRGRGKQLEPSPVKQMAQQHGLSVRTPGTLRDAEVQQELAALQPEAICVAAYGMILPKEVLGIPRYGCLNVHASSLPRWRGAAPVERAILAGDEEAGVCVMRMEEGLDTGDYCICRNFTIGDTPAEMLTDELANLGSHALLSALAMVAQGLVKWTVQDESQVTYAAKIEKGELDARLADDAQTVVRKVQASSAAHPSRAVIAGRSVTVLGAGLPSAEQADLVRDMTPDSVRFVAKRLFIGASDEAVEILQVKPDGKSIMDAKAFAAGIQGIKQGACQWEEAHA